MDSFDSSRASAAALHRKLPMIGWSWIYQSLERIDADETGSSTARRSNRIGTSAVLATHRGNFRDCPTALTFCCRRSLSHQIGGTASIRTIGVGPGAPLPFL